MALGLVAFVAFFPAALATTFLATGASLVGAAFLVIVALEVVFWCCCVCACGMVGGKRGRHGEVGWGKRERGEAVPSRVRATGARHYLCTRAP